ncbi:hypothetical protein [Streptomyces sp. NPDC059906]|uniref:hypothetical protein n=1 Tax=Streptomyces sp. NPDC059906 TaxID=3346997 RepID=UPI00365A58B5
MNFWNEPGRAVQDAGQAGDGVQAIWDQLDHAEAVGVAAVCAARLSKGDLVLAKVPMGSTGSAVNTRQALEDFVRGRGISVDTADQYRRVSAWYTAERREAIAGTGGVASYTLLREVALHTFGTADDPDVRFGLLLEALRSFAPSGSTHLTRQEYLRLLGAGPTSRDVPASAPNGVEPGGGEQVSALDGVRTDPAVVTAVLRTVADDPDELARFFGDLAAEGGLEVLNCAALALRRAKAGARAQESQVFGTDEPAEPLEVILRMVLRAMKALKEPLDLDPSQVVEALPPEQFQALSRLCGSITEWHELLLAEVRAGIHMKEEVA